jgi:DNA polymerase sigma
MDCKMEEDTCARCNKKHRTSTCKETDTATFKCSNCMGTNAVGHRAADRNCPAFKTELDKLHNRIPDNKYKYFPTNAPRTWSLLNEAENSTQHEQRAQDHTGISNSQHVRTQHNPPEEWHSTRRGRPQADKLTYKDRHYTPPPRTDT